METSEQAAQLSFWQRNKVVFKGFLIGFLTLLLLIPTVMISDLIEERQSRQEEAVKEVNSKWAGGQTITGPIIAVPYNVHIQNSKGEASVIKEYAYFLPAALNIHTEIVPEKRNRGIYSVVVYNSRINITGKFESFKPELLSIAPEDMLWNEAIVNFKVSDVRGLNDVVRFVWEGQSVELIPGNAKVGDKSGYLGSNFPATVTSLANGGSFELSISVKGSENLMFVPVGKETAVKVVSPWPDPGFTGAFLPEQRSVTDNGFSASWKVLYLNRNYPQHWKDVSYDLEKSAFGLNLLIPVDAYQKSMRSVKYAILCIVLTFMAFLLIELIYRKSVHPFQYVLVGFALCIFYTLLISISEYIEFGFSYLIAAVATVTLISLYVRTLFASNKMALFITFLLCAMYGFIYILIQSQDYALLMGSIGLFITLALIMYFSKRARLN
jgi:inner membrane protein